MTTDCIFCEIVADRAPATKVYEDDTVVAFLDLFPATEGHLLVIPKTHSRDLLEIAPDDLSAVALAGQRIAQAVVDEFGAAGVNLLNCCGADAWQTVFHFHLHVIPRYTDDTKDQLRLPWTPGQMGDEGVRAELGARLAARLA